jgi:hypothetical protein
MVQNTIAKTNRERRHALADANIEYSRPFLDLTTEAAAEYVYRHGVLQSTDPQPGTWAHFTRLAPPWSSSVWQLKDTL